MTGDVTDYAPAGLSGASLLVVTSTVPANINGLASGAPTRALWVRNGNAAGGPPIRFNALAGSAANQLLQSVVLPPGCGAGLMYDGAAARWFVTTSVASAQYHWGSTSSGNATVSRFYHAWFGAAAAPAASNSGRLLVQRAGVITNLQQRYLVALATANTQTTLQLNGVDTSLVCDTPAGTLISPLTGAARNMILVGPGDTLNVRSVTSVAESTTSDPRATVQFFPSD